MRCFAFQPNLHSSLSFLLLLLAGMGLHAAFSQESQLFRSVGLELNVDPIPVMADAAAMVDVNNDGWLDLFPGKYLLQSNGVINASLQSFKLDTTSILDAECRFADFDNDGWIDAYSTVQTYSRDFLFHNTGSGVFIEVAESMGISYTGSKFTLACGLADYDNDGWVDILVGSHIIAGEGSGIWLWKNQGGKKFVNVADQMQANVPSGYCGVAWADIDNDGDQDFFGAGHRSGDVLLRNDEDRFVNITEVAKISAVGVVGSSRSGSWGDYNNDGRLDLYNCDDEKMNRLYRNDGDGVAWPDVAKELHVSNLDPTGWSPDKSATATWGDYDNDGDLDLAVISMGGKYNQGSENRLYRNDGAAGFVEVGQGTELADQGQTHYAGTFGDVDNDGDLDLYIGIGPSLIEPSLGGSMDLLFENLIGNQNNWLEFRLTGVKSNRSAIGARVRCVSANHPLQIREVQGGHGYNSMGPLTQHFGFGQDTVVDSVIIHWPSGVKDRFVNVPVNQILDITEGSASGVASRVVMPLTSCLHGNYPNPFNSQTIIHFSLDRLAMVTVKVVNVLGREVRTLVENRLLSGHQQVRWDGRDNAQCPVATGTYMCRLTVDGMVVTHQMTLLN